MTNEMKIARKTMNDLYEMIDKKIDENISSPYSEKREREFDKLIAQRSAIHAACMIFSGDLSPEIALSTAARMLSLYYELSRGKCEQIDGKTWRTYHTYGELYYQVQHFREIKRSSYRILVE